MYFLSSVCLQIKQGSHIWLYAELLSVLMRQQCCIIYHVINPRSISIIENTRNFQILQNFIRLRQKMFPLKSKAVYNSSLETGHHLSWNQKVYLVFVNSLNDLNAKSRWKAQSPQCSETLVSEYIRCMHVKESGSPGWSTQLHECYF